MTSRRWRVLLAGIAIAVVVLLTGLEVVVQPAAGQTTAWTRLGTQDVHALSFPGPGSDLVLSGHHQGVMRSEDGGRTWTALGFAADAMAVLAAPDGSIVVAGHELLAESGDGGDSWQPIDADLPSLDVHASARSVIDPNRMWAYVAGDGIHESLDAGRTWTLVNDRDAVQLAAANQGDRDVLFGVDPFRGLIRSEDGARSWEIIGAPPVSPVTALAVDTAASSLVVGGPTGLFRSDDGGMTWRSVLDVGTVLAAAVGRDGATIGAVTADTRFYRSDDGGVTWPAPLGTEPTPVPTPMRGSDSRGGMSASMIGDPVGAAVAVILLGLVTALVTVGSIRLRQAFER